MRRIDPVTFTFFRRSLESNRLAKIARVRPLPPEPQLVDDDDESEPINSWESAWIDLGGEG
jgi:hypothetical protein